MSQLKNWWIGILALLIIWVVANFVMTDRVESDLAARATAAVAAGPILDKPAVTVAGLPGFTVSIGVIEAEASEDLPALTARADVALFAELKFDLASASALAEAPAPQDNRPPGGARIHAAWGSADPRSSGRSASS